MRSATVWEDQITGEVLAPENGVLTVPLAPGAGRVLVRKRGNAGVRPRQPWPSTAGPSNIEDVSGAYAELACSFYPSLMNGLACHVCACLGASTDTAGRGGLSRHAP
jgi:hypothetical protein